MTQHQYFQGFGQQSPQQAPKVSDEDMYLEIYNNWPHVRWLMDRRRNGDKFNVLQIDADWINFLTAKKIDIESFTDKEEFLTKFFTK